jgi:ribulose-phosphate 3-epimerase
MLTIKKIEIAPSILSADFRNLEKALKDAQAAGADRIHCDVMDGHFVPNLTFGPLVIEAVKKCVTIPIDVHLMISNPVDYISAYCNAGADVLIVHAEACKDVPGIVSKIKKQGVRAGITVNPDISMDLFLPYLADIDQVLIMTVYAGFGAQKFIPETAGKVRTVFEETVRRCLAVDIEVDGGINDETAKICAENGANVFVAGNYVFKGENYSERIQAIRESAEKSWKKGFKI